MHANKTFAVFNILNFEENNTKGLRYTWKQKVEFIIYRVNIL